MQTEKVYEKDNNIFQSKAWAEFQEAIGREAIEVDGNYFYKEHLVKGKYFLYCPKGPIEIQKSKVKSQNFSSKFKSLKDVVFVRTEPKDSSRFGSNDKGYVPVTKNTILSQQYSPKQTLVLDLTKSEEELLAGMKSKHRYNIRLAEKKEVKIKSGYSDEDIDNFYALSLEVSERDGTFSPHPKSYYDKMVKTLGPKGNLKIFTAFYNKEPISSIIVLFQNDTAIYLHGASSNKYRELMPNHLVQWTAIKEAKKKGCKFYDFWGTSLRQETISSKQLTGNDEVWDFKIYGKETFEAIKNGKKRYETRAGRKKGEGKDWAQIKSGDTINFSLADPKTDKPIENEKQITKMVVINQHFKDIDSLLKTININSISATDEKDFRNFWKNHPVLDKRIEKHGIWAIELSEPENNWTVDEAHSWAGITKFKLGFVKIGETGEVLEFPGAYDLPLNKFWYNGLGFLNSIRKLVKR